MGKIATIVEVNGAKCIAEVLTASHTDWSPRVFPAAYSVPGSSEVGAPIISDTFGDAEGFNAIVRPDTGNALGYVRGRYKAQDHRAQLVQLDGLIADGTLSPESVNVWDGGGMLAYQFRVPSLDMVINGVGQKDVVSPLLTLAFFHNGAGSDLAFFADFRWFCKNQMGRVAQVNSGNGRAVHKGDNAGRYAEMIQSRITELGGSLTERYEGMRQMREVQLKETPALYGYWAKSMLTADPEAVVKELTGVGKPSAEAKVVQAIGAEYMKDDCGAPGSVWQAYNAVTRYLTHSQGRNEGNRIQRALLGPGKEFQSAFREAIRIAA